MCPFCLNFRLITAKFSGVRKYRYFTVSDFSWCNDFDYHLEDSYLVYIEQTGKLGLQLPLRASSVLHTCNVVFTPTPIPPDLNRGLYCERVGVVLSAPIRSYHVLMSILTIGLIVKFFFPINTITSTIGTIASDRMTS